MRGGTGWILLKYSSILKLILISYGLSDLCKQCQKCCHLNYTNNWNVFDFTVVQRVTGREHTVQGEALTVHPFVISKTELLLEEVPDTVSEENLANFMEAKLKVQVISVAFSQDRSRALVQFGNEFSEWNFTIYMYVKINISPLMFSVQNFDMYVLMLNLIQIWNWQFEMHSVLNTGTRWTDWYKDWMSYTWHTHNVCFIYTEFLL